jgi:acetyl-CoA acetyltransferase
MAVAGVDPDEMGIGPVYAIPRLLEKHGLTVDDIGIWELNEGLRRPGDPDPRPARHLQRAG